MEPNTAKGQSIQEILPSNEEEQIRHEVATAFDATNLITNNDWLLNIAAIQIPKGGDLYCAMQMFQRLYRLSHAEDNLSSYMAIEFNESQQAKSHVAVVSSIPQSTLLSMWDRTLMFCSQLDAAVEQGPVRNFDIQFLVGEIAFSIVSTLCTLYKHDICHGNLCQETIRIQKSGENNYQVVLTGFGLKQLFATRKISGIEVGQDIEALGNFLSQLLHESACQFQSSSNSADLAMSNIEYWTPSLTDFIQLCSDKSKSHLRNKVDFANRLLHHPFIKWYIRNTRVISLNHNVPRFGNGYVQVEEVSVDSPSRLDTIARLKSAWQRLYFLVSVTVCDNLGLDLLQKHCMLGRDQESDGMIKASETSKTDVQLSANQLCSLFCSVPGSNDEYDKENDTTNDCVPTNSQSITETSNGKNKTALHGRQTAMLNTTTKEQESEILATSTYAWIAARVIREYHPAVKNESQHRHVREVKEQVTSDGECGKPFLLDAENAMGCGNETLEFDAAFQWISEINTFVIEVVSLLACIEIQQNKTGDEYCAHTCTYMKQLLKILQSRCFHQQSFKDHPKVGLPPKLRPYVWAVLLGLEQSTCSVGDLSDAKCGGVVNLNVLLRHKSKLSLLNCSKRVLEEHSGHRSHGVSELQRQLNQDLPRCHQYSALMQSGRMKQRLALWLTRFMHGSPLSQCVEHVYWQGLDSVCAIFGLTFINSDDDTVFFLFDQFVRMLQPNMYVQNNSASIQARTHALMSMVVFHDPQLANHLRDIEMDLTLFVLRWIMTMLSYSLPYTKTQVVWDFVLLSQSSQSFKNANHGGIFVMLAATILFHCRDKILNCESDGSVVSYLNQFTTGDEFDVSELIQACRSLLMTTPNFVEFNSLDHSQQHPQQHVIVPRQFCPPSISFEELNRLLEMKKLIVIDTRSRASYKLVHVRGSISVGGAMDQEGNHSVNLKPKVIASVKAKLNTKLSQIASKPVVVLVAGSSKEFGSENIQLLWSNALWQSGSLMVCCLNGALGDAFQLPSLYPYLEEDT